MRNLRTSYYLPKRIISFFFNENWYNKIKLSTLILDYKLHRPYEMSRLFKNILSSDAIVFDIGANMGHYACRLNDIVKKGTGHIYCFEPVEANFAALRAMKKTLKLKSISITKLGVSDVAKEATISIPLYNNGLVVGTQATLLEKKGINYKTEKIKITTIDTFVSENKIKKVDFIKCDTEGNENNVLNGGKQTITKFLPILSFEMSYKDKELNWVLQLGYKLFYYDSRINKFRRINNYQSGNLIMIHDKNINDLAKVINSA